MSKYIIAKKLKNYPVSYYHRTSTPNRVLWSSLKMYAKVFDTKENAELTFKQISKNKKHTSYGILSVTAEQGFGSAKDWDDNIQVDTWNRS